MKIAATTGRNMIISDSYTIFWDLSGPPDYNPNLVPKPCVSHMKAPQGQIYNLPLSIVLHIIIFPQQVYSFQQNFVLGAIP